MNPNHHEALRRKHARLDSDIRAAEASPAPDDIEIRSLKKQKLALKDAIASQQA